MKTSSLVGMEGVIGGNLTVNGSSPIISSKLVTSPVIECESQDSSGEKGKDSSPASSLVGTKNGNGNDGKEFKKSHQKKSKSFFMMSNYSNHDFMNDFLSLKIEEKKK